MKWILKLFILVNLGIVIIPSLKLLLNKKELPQITAHRGDCLNYPENTMSAFFSAQKLGTDWIELDVRQTKDKKLVVIHDDNLKKFLNVNNKISNMNYEEISKLVIQKDDKKACIPLLEDVLKYAKEYNIKLNIDLKQSKKEENYVEIVIKLIEKYDLVERAVLSSFNYEMLLKVKKINSNIKTLYIVSKMREDILDYSVDGYSMRIDLVNKELVDLIHEKGKEVHVWIVNDEEEIRKMLELKVDNIITDDVKLVKEIIKE